MGWSSLRQIPNEYNDGFKEIDEKILKLIMERQSMAKGKRFFPNKEVVEAWSKQFDMKVPELNLFLHTINWGARPIHPNEKGELKGILPIMKKTVKDEIEYTLTHAMLYEQYSEVHLDIINKGEGSHMTHIHPQIHLKVIGDKEYFVENHGMHGGGNQTSMQFLVSPPLPEDLKTVELSLIPFVSRYDRRVKELILDQPIDFE